MALRRDLIHEDGPRISTMRNYRFAIVQYAPSDEFRLRSEVQKLTSDLTAKRLGRIIDQFAEAPPGSRPGARRRVDGPSD